ncbi:MAG: hybrid sensor histidine kinase/response regulator [Anaerolineae bacterium]|nr:hybrid sensor histidine kinase/response regulator [Anaerolineae bacterium]
MSISAKIREELIGSFRAELNEHIQTMTDGLLALEQGSVTGKKRQAMLENTFRAAHSLKGAARAMGVAVIEQLAHALEGLLDGIQHDAIELTADLFTACYQALDAIQAVQAAYEAGETTPPVQALQALTALDPFRPSSKETAREREVEQPSPAASPVEVAKPAPLTVTSPAVDETIRVSVGKLDTLMAQLTELLITKIRAEQHLTQIQQLQEFAARWQREWLAVRSVYGKVARQGPGQNGPGKDTERLLEYLETSQERLREVNVLIGNMAHEYANDSMHMSSVIDGLEDEIKRARMQPLSTITGSFGRMVRDMAREAGKEAGLRIVGGDTELDKQVLERIKDPLIHLLRNAVGHGIEPPEEREAAGKPRRGAVTLTAEQLGQDVVICIDDDGAGLDLEAIRQAIAKHDKIEAESLTEAELIDAIFRPGISTSRIITDISGRGVGLDVVRRNVEALQGRVYVEWTPGGGASFTLTLPLRLTSSRGLLVHSSDELFAIPLNNVERIIHVSPEEITPLEGHDTVRCNGQPIPLVWLSDVLNLPRKDTKRDKVSTPVVILSAIEQRMAFAVDGLAGEQEVVIKGLGKQLVRVGGIVGATIIGTGDVVLILNVADLIRLGLRGERGSVLRALEQTTSPADIRAKHRILIVDDSITTRTLEKNILEAIGYNVEVATDGQEALNTIAESGVPDLIISDILMPRVNGFELTERIKEDPKTAQVPVILVTSLGSAEDKTRGIEAGADAYIVKSAFDQGNLLETIEQLI